MEDSPKFSPEVEEASEKFTRALPVFKTLVNSTKSRKSLVRVLKAIAEFPLGENYPKFADKFETELFAIFQELSANKQVVLTGFLHAELMKGESDGKEQGMAENRDNP